MKRPDLILKSKDGRFVFVTIDIEIMQAHMASAITRRLRAAGCNERDVQRLLKTTINKREKQQ